MFATKLPEGPLSRTLNRRFLAFHRLLEGLDEQPQHVVLRRLLANHFGQTLGDDLALVVGDGHVRLLQGRPLGR